MKKKILVGLMVLVMLGSTVAGVVAYWPVLNPEPSDPFADVPYPAINSFNYADLSGEDLTSVDLTTTKDPATLTFDTSTKWPAKDKMPEGFSPDALLDQGRYLGLGLDSLHERGITGEGVAVAVIDRPTLKEHEEFAENLQYNEPAAGDADSVAVNFHGAAITGILAGKHGVAPDAKIHYFAIPGDNAYTASAQALDKVIALNKTLGDGEKIRVVAAAQSVNPLDEAANVSGAKDWSAAIKRAEAEGIIVIYPSMTAVELTGAGVKPGKDRDDPENYVAWTWTSAKAWAVEKIRAAGAKSWEDVRKELIRLLTEQPDLDSLQAEALNTYIYLAESYKQTSTFENWIAVAEGNLSKALAVPVDCITLATADANDSYAYYGSGGLSWASPYVAGLIALGLQVNPSATAGELFAALMETGTPFVTGGKLVNPGAFVQAVKALK